MKSSWSMKKYFEALLLIILVALLILPEVFEMGIRYKFDSIENCTAGNIIVSIPRRSIRVADVSLSEFPAGEGYIVNGKIKSIKISGIHIFDLIYKNSIVMDEIVLRAPELQINALRNSQYTQPLTNESSFAGLHLKRVKVVKGNFSGTDTLGAISRVNDLDLEIGPLELEGDSVVSKVSDWKVSSGSINHITADRLYRYSLHKLKGSSKK